MSGEIQQHKFLDLLRSEENSLTKNRAKSIVLRLIAKNTNIRNAKDGFLFRPELSYTEMNDLEKEEVNSILLELISEKMILVVYSFSFDYETNKLIVLPGFIAQPAEKKQTIYAVYSELVDVSVIAFQNYLKSIKKLSEEGFITILTTNKNNMQTNPSKNSSPLIFNILEYSKKINFLHSPSAEFFLAISMDIIEKLEQRNIGMSIDKNSFLIINNSYLPDYYKWTKNFFEKEILSALKKKADINEQLEKIHLHENLYRLQPFQDSRKADFIRMKALVFENYQQYKTSEPVFYQGWLTTFILVRFATTMDSYYSEQRKNELESNIKEIKESLKNLQGHWETLIFFVKESEEFDLVADIKKRLDNDAEIASIEWEFPEGKISAYVFIHGNIFRSLVYGMDKLPKQYYWRILLLKNLIDQVDEKIKIIFEDQEFVKTYGRLIRKAYIEEIPWYLQIFVKLNIPFFIDIAFRIGKEKIVERQKIFRKKNISRRNEKQKLIDLHTNKVKEKISETEIKDKITKAINDTIYLQGKLPTFDRVAVLTKMERKLLDEWIEKLHFVKFSTKEADSNSTVLLYVLDQSWRVKADKLYRHIEEKMEHSINEKDKVVLLKIKEFLDKNVTLPEPPKKEADPYERFARALEEQKSKENDLLKKYF